MTGHFVPGAQTERRGDAGPVRGLLGGMTSPAALSLVSSPQCVDTPRPRAGYHAVLAKPFHDALMVAVMQANGLTNIASHDADCDRVPGLSVRASEPA
jgi:hypothetical protein